MKISKITVSIIIIIVVFTFAAPLHVHRKMSSTTDFITGDNNTTTVTELSNGSVNVVTSSNIPSYYIENETGFNQTEYTFNITGFLNSRDNGLTENCIIAKQGNNTLFGISYGRQNTVTKISGKQNYTGILNFSKCNFKYNLHIVFSNSMKDNALVWQGNYPIIPYMITLQKPYIKGNISFMFGGEYSNQTIGIINIANYKNIKFSDSACLYNFTHSISIYLKPQPVNDSQTIFLDNQLNSLIYITVNGTVEKYNYYNKSYTTIARMNIGGNGNISSLCHGNEYIYYAWNSTEISVYSINKTTLSVEHESFKNNNMTHILFYNNSYVFYNLNGTIMFPDGKYVNIRNRILAINAGRNINLIALNKTGIINYIITPEYNKKESSFHALYGKYSIVYFYINNGISSYFQRGNTTASINGTLYYKFHPLGNNIGVDNNTVYINTNGKIENSEIKLDGTLSYSSNTIIVSSGNHITLHTDDSLRSSDMIAIKSVKENVRFNDTIIFLNISSALNYSVTASLLNRTYNISDNQLNIATNIKSGNYTIYFIAVNSAGYTCSKKYTFIYNDTAYKIVHTANKVNGIKIIQHDNAFYVSINGNYTNNLTIAWYINGRYSNSGNRLTSELPLGFDLISVKVIQDKHEYEAEKRVTNLGNIPYYAGFAGIVSVICIFIVETFYYNNKDVDYLLEELNGSRMKDIIKAARRKRIRKSVVMSKIKLLSLSGKLSIERDMDNNKFIFLTKKGTDDTDEIKT